MNQRAVASPLDRLLSIDGVCERVALGATRVRELVRDRGFPAPIKIGRSTRWSEREVQAWIAERLADRCAK